MSLIDAPAGIARMRPATSPNSSGGTVASLSVFVNFLCR
jgi:hypothetical protein